MLGGYKSTESSGNSSSGKTHSGTAALAEVKEGAERLAKELDEYLRKSSNSKISHFGKDGASTTSGEAVADLQLATARKLREVCFLKEASAIILSPEDFPFLITFTRPLCFCLHLACYRYIVQR
jgi:hypothetical protein